MPASPRSLQVTDRYQQTLRRLRAMAARIVEATWAMVAIDDLDGTYNRWAENAATHITTAQQQAAALSAAYLAAFRASETGGRPTPPTFDSARYVGTTRAGVPVATMLGATLAGMLTRIAQRDSATTVSAARLDAVAWALQRNQRMAGDEAVHAARSVLSDAINADRETYRGWRRVPGPGACIVCLATADGQISRADRLLRVHDHCTCVTEPVIAAVPEHAHRESGPQRFASLTEDEQNELAGQDTAQALRDGRISLGDLVGLRPMSHQDDQLVQRSLEDALAAGH
jgi:hypothetical protein